MRSASSRWPRRACSRSRTRPAPSSPTTAARRPAASSRRRSRAAGRSSSRSRRWSARRAYGTPTRKASGLDANRLSLLIAVLGRRAGIGLGSHDVYANLAGGLSVVEPALDLPLALALASSPRDQADPIRDRGDRRGRPARRAPLPWSGSSGGCARPRGSGSRRAIVPRPSAGSTIAAIDGLDLVVCRHASRRDRDRADRSAARSWRGGPRDARLTTAGSGRSSRPTGTVGAEGTVDPLHPCPWGRARGRHRARPGRLRRRVSFSDGSTTQAPCSPPGSWPGSCVGFAILPYLTVVPATWLVRRVEELSTAEFVAAVLGSAASAC